MPTAHTATLTAVDPEWVRASVIAEKVGLSRFTINKWRNSGRIPAGCWRQLNAGQATQHVIIRYDLEKTISHLSALNETPDGG